MFVHRVSGGETVLSNLGKAREAQAKVMEIRIRKMVLFVLRKSNETVPVEHGQLKASGFARVTGSGFKTKGRVGYTAEYAIYVHENLDALHGDDYNTVYRRDIAAGRKRARGSGQRAKFLEDAIRENEFEIKDIAAGRKDK